METHKLILPDGTAVTSGAQEKYAIQSVTLTESVNAGDEPTLGSACASLLEATVFTPAGGLKLTAGDEVTLYRGEEKIGIFILEKPTRPSANTLKLTGYDRIIRLDKDLTAWFAALEGFPMNLQTFARLVCGECGLELENTQLLNGDMTVPQFTRDGVTGRQLMQWVGEASGSFVRATAEGKIHLAAYIRRNITVSPTGEPYYFAGGLSYEDYEVEPVDAVQLRLGSGEDGYLWPAGAENGYVIAGNPLLQVTEDTAARFDALRSRIPSGYRPCKIAMPASMEPRPGDIFTVRDKNGAEFTACVMTKVTQGQRMTVECVGSRRRASASAVNGRTPAQIAQQAVQSQTQQDIFLKLTDNGKLRGLFMKDGELYINADFLSTGVIRSADGTVNIDLSNNIIEVATNNDGIGKIVLSAWGMKGYGWDHDKGDYVESFNVYPSHQGGGRIAPTMITSGANKNGLWLGSSGNATTRLGQGGSVTEIVGSKISMNGTVYNTLLFDGAANLNGSFRIPNADNYSLFSVQLDNPGSGRSAAPIIAYKSADSTAASRIMGVGGWAGTQSEKKELFFVTLTRLSDENWIVEDARSHTVNGDGTMGPAAQMRVIKVIGIL